MINLRAGNRLRNISNDKKLSSSMTVEESSSVTAHEISNKKDTA